MRPHRPLARSAARASRAGFTLIEVLAALAIFSIAIVGLLVNLRETIGAQQRVFSISHAASLAENVMEETKLSGKVELGAQSGQFKDDDAAYAWSTQTDETKTDNLRQVAVTVSWPEGTRTRDYTITTLVLVKE